MKNNSHPSLFGNGAFYKRAMGIALPVMFQSMIQSLVSLVDNFMVAGLGDIKMAGVNIAGQVSFLFICIMNTVCAAGGIFLTQYSGADDRRGMRQALCFKVVMLGLFLLLFIPVCLFPRPFMLLMLTGNAQSEAILAEGIPYMRLSAFCAIPMVLSTIIASSFRETGDVRAPLVISIIGTLVNTFFNWCFIYGNLGFARMEVCGAAYATIIARLVEMCLYIVLYLRKKPKFMLQRGDLKHIDFTLFGRILRKGSLMIFSDSLWVVSETISTALYNGRGGADVVSGMSASFAIANLFFVSFGGINTATSVIIGQSLGSGDLDEAREEKRWLMSGSIIFGAGMTLIAMLTRQLIPIVFGNLSAEAQALAQSMVFWLGMFMPLWVYNNAQFSVSRAGGDTMMGAIVDGGVTSIISIPLMFFLAYRTSAGPDAMYLYIKLLDILKVAISCWWLAKEKWVVNLAETTEN